jgi:hypothetical protein
MSTEVIHVPSLSCDSTDTFTGHTKYSEPQLVIDFTNLHLPIARLKDDPPDLILNRSILVGIFFVSHVRSI